MKKIYQINKIHIEKLIKMEKKKKLLFINLKMGKK